MDFPHSVVFLALFVIAAAGNNSANDTGKKTYSYVMKHL